MKPNKASTPEPIVAAVYPTIDVPLFVKGTPNVSFVTDSFLSKRDQSSKVTIIANVGIRIDFPIGENTVSMNFKYADVILNMETGANFVRLTPKLQRNYRSLTPMWITSENQDVASEFEGLINATAACALDELAKIKEMPDPYTGLPYHPNEGRMAARNVWTKLRAEFPNPIHDIRRPNSPISAAVTAAQHEDENEF